MERTALPGVAQRDAVGHTAGGVRRLRRRLEPVALQSLILERWCEAAAWTSSLVAAWFFVDFALKRHANYQSTAYDFGFFDQIIWNTSRGRWFETSFVDYNFFGQHVEPVLLIFAGMYRLGAGPEALLVAQAVFVGMAAVPLFYAVRRMTGVPVVALVVALAYLLNPSLHGALDFDFHPELMAPLFVFTGIYLLAARRPLAALIAVAAVLLLKEDMALVALMFGVVLWSQGWRRHGMLLAVVAVLWGAATVFLLMPFVRGGGSDLNERFSYLVADTNAVTVLPVAMWRGVSHLADNTLDGVTELLAGGGWVALFSPAVLLAVPSAVLNGLSDHPQQAKLDLHYGVAAITLLTVATTFALADLARGRLVGRFITARLRPAAVTGVAAMLLTTTVFAFVDTSPYSPRTRHYGPNEHHRSVISTALSAIPRDASVSAQNTLLPHLSQRRHIYEFPNVPSHVEWAVIDATLSVTAQTRESGYDRGLGDLESSGFSLVFDQDGVRVFSRTANP